MQNQVPVGQVGVGLRPVPWQLKQFAVEPLAEGIGDAEEAASPGFAKLTTRIACAINTRLRQKHGGNPESPCFTRVGFRSCSLTSGVA
jgi:hypothetical protein